MERETVTEKAAFTMFKDTLTLIKYVANNLIVYITIESKFTDCYFLLQIYLIEIS